jgi:hypothetical protein
MVVIRSRRLHLIFLPILPDRCPLLLKAAATQAAFIPLHGSERIRYSAVCHLESWSDMRLHLIVPRTRYSWISRRLTLCKF